MQEDEYTPIASEEEQEEVRVEEPQPVVEPEVVKCAAQNRFNRL